MFPEIKVWLHFSSFFVEKKKKKKKKSAECEKEHLGLTGNL